MPKLIFLRRTQNEVEVFGGEVFVDIDGKNNGKVSFSKQEIRSCASEIAGICSGYSLLNGVESAARTVSEYYISAPSDSSPDSLISYIDDATEFNNLVIALEEANQSVLEPLIGSR